MGNDYQTSFVQPAPLVPELLEGLRAREEAQEFDLRGCPVCGTSPRVLKRDGSVTLACPHKRHKIVSAATMTEAAGVWNQPRFTEATS